MDEPNYARLFHKSIIPGFATKHNAAVRQADPFQLVQHHGSYRCVGVQGSIAHNSARIAAMVGSVGVSIGEKAWKNRKDSTKKKLAF